jgi:hypothetical protein
MRKSSLRALPPLVAATLQRGIGRAPSRRSRGSWIAIRDGHGALEVFAERVMDVQIVFVRQTDEAPGALHFAPHFTF